MAELHVQKKRSSAVWFWIFLVILLAAGGIYYYLHTRDPREYPLPSKPTSFIIYKNVNYV
jgi:flagellar basal body-associated protein FliL